MIDPTTPPAPLPARDRWRLQTRRALLTCVALFAGCNVLLPWLFLSWENMTAVFLVTMAGTICAQLGLQGVWFVLAPVGPGKRLVWGIAAGLFLLAAWLIGWGIGDFGAFRYVLATALTYLPLTVVAVQTPLWLARGFFGWRIVHRRDPARRSPVKRMGIRHLLIATGVLAAAFSAAHVALMLVDWWHDSALLELVLVAGVMAGASLFTLLPTLAATLRIRRTILAVLALLAIYVGAVGAWLLIRSGLQHSMVSQDDCIGVLLVSASYFVCLAGPLLLLRRLGYRLYCSPRAPRKDPSSRGA